MEMYEYEEYVKAKHAGQTRWNGKPSSFSKYFNEHCVKVSQHVINVANSFIKKDDLNLQLSTRTIEKLWAIGLGHDLLEDTNATFDEIKNLAGEKVASAILILTKEDKESYFDYIMRIKDSDDLYAKLVKLADLECNMSDLKPGSMKDKYELAHHIIKESL
jgi:(p)ppGpp synthase/HD superfamily hydrolase